MRRSGHPFSVGIPPLTFKQEDPSRITQLPNGNVCEIGEGINENQRLIIERQLIGEMSHLTAPE